MHSFTKSPIPLHLALRPPPFYAQTASFLGRIRTYRQTTSWPDTSILVRVYLCRKQIRGHTYTMSTIDTLSATQRDTIHMRLSFKFLFSLLPEGVGDVPNFIRLEMGAALALRISKFIIGVYPNW